MPLHSSHYIFAPTYGFDNTDVTDVWVHNIQPAYSWYLYDVYSQHGSETYMFWHSLVYRFMIAVDSIDVQLMLPGYTCTWFTTYEHFWTQMLQYEYYWLWCYTSDEQLWSQMSDWRRLLVVWWTFILVYEMSQSTVEFVLMARIIDTFVHLLIIVYSQDIFV